MKSKRSLSVLLIVLMLAIVITGCSKSKTTGTTDEEKVTLTFGLWDKNQEPIMREIADLYEAQNTNVKVDIQLTPYSQYWTKLETAATGEVLPDIFWINGPNIVKYAVNDMLVSLNEKIKTDNIDLTVYPQALNDLYTVDGKQYGIPKDWDLTALWYNKQLFDDAGVEYPNDTWTWDDLVKAARKLTNPSKGIYGIAARAETQEGIYDTIPQAGGFIVSDDRKTSGYGSEEAIAGTQIWVDLIKEGISPTLEQQTDTNGVELFKGEKVAMVYAASWNVPEFMNNERIADHIDLTIMPLIKERAATIHGLSNAIAANSKHKEEAWDFVKYLSSKEANEVWAKSGVVIPAHQDVLDIWESSYPNVNLNAFVTQLDTAVMYPVSMNTSKWNDIENEYIKQIWTSNITVEDGLTKIAELMDSALSEEN